MVLHKVVYLYPKTKVYDTTRFKEVRKRNY